MKTILRNWQHWVHKTQDEDKQNKNTTQKTKEMSNMNPTKNRGMNPGTHEWQAGPKHGYHHFIKM
jgi:hypothetical protein